MFKEIVCWSNLHAIWSNIWYCKKEIQVTSDIELNNKSESRTKFDKCSWFVTHTQYNLPVWNLPLL